MDPQQKSGGDGMDDKRGLLDAVLGTTKDEQSPRSESREYIPGLTPAGGEGEAMDIDDGDVEP